MGLLMTISYTLLMLGRRLIGRRFAGDEPSLFTFIIYNVIVYNDIR